MQNQYGWEKRPFKIYVEEIDSVSASSETPPVVHESKSSRNQSHRVEKLGARDLAQKLPQTERRGLRPLNA